MRKPNAFFVVLLAITPLAVRSPLAHVSVTLTATAIFLAIVRKITPGGWRWRSGKEDDQ